MAAFYTGGARQVNGGAIDFLVASRYSVVAGGTPIMLSIENAAVVCGEKIVVGGAKRAASMAAGLEHVDEEVEFVCVHDASRPMVGPALIAETVKSACRHGSGVAAVEIPDAVVSANKGAIDARLDKEGRLWAAISPQTWHRAALAKAYPKAAKNRKNYEDDLEAMLAAKIEPRLVPTAAISLRIRSADDLAPVLALMK